MARLRWCLLIQVCRKCQLEKTAEEFCRKKERSDGLDSYCKLCNAKATAERFKRRQPVHEPRVADKVCLAHAYWVCS